LKTSGYHVGYRNNRMEQTSKPIAQSHYGGMKGRKIVVEELPQQIEEKEEKEESKGYDNV